MRLYSGVCVCVCVCARACVRACDHRVHTKLQYITIVACVRCGWLPFVFLLQTLSAAAIYSCNCRKQTLLPVSWAVSPPPCASHMPREPLRILTLAARCKQGEIAHLRLLTSDYLLGTIRVSIHGWTCRLQNARFTTCKIGYLMNPLTVLAQHVSSRVLPSCVHV